MRVIDVRFFDCPRMQKFYIFHSMFANSDSIAVNGCTVVAAAQLVIDMF